MKNVMSAGLFAALIALGSPMAFGQGQEQARGKGAMTAEHQNLSREQRIEMLEKMAKAHQAGADCLRAGKTEEECRAVMMENCPMEQKGGMKGKGGSCPMMEAGMHMMRGQGMHGNRQGKMKSHSHGTQGSTSNAVDKPASDTSQQKQQGSQSGSSQGE